MITVYKDYEIEIKMVQGQWFLQGYNMKIGGLGGGGGRWGGGGGGGGD